MSVEATSRVGWTHPHPNNTQKLGKYGTLAKIYLSIWWRKRDTLDPKLQATVGCCMTFTFAEKMISLVIILNTGLVESTERFLSQAQQTTHSIVYACNKWCLISIPVYYSNSDKSISNKWVSLPSDRWMSFYIHECLVRTAVCHKKMGTKAMGNHTNPHNWQDEFTVLQHIEITLLQRQTYLKNSHSSALSINGIWSLKAPPTRWMSWKHCIFIVISLACARFPGFQKWTTQTFITNFHLAKL